MPEKITLQDGSEREVPTDEELKNLQAGHDANASKKPIVEEYTKMKEALDLKEGQTVDDRLKEMKESESPNWKAMRESNNSLKAKLIELGQTVDDEGKVTEKVEGLTQEDVQTTVDNSLLSQKKEALLQNYTAEQRKTIEPVLDKFMSVGGTLEENFNLAVSRSFPDEKIDTVKQVFHNSEGNAPIRKDNNDTSMSDDVKDLGKKMGLTDDELNKVNK